jgi:hypothetical protein
MNRLLNFASAVSILTMVGVGSAFLVIMWASATLLLRLGLRTKL